ncbi:MAG: hypothetical protein HeimC2_41580 [Candidatus Heimdallarchaeota archaeon LC_2]|nr:MAG: hypothetical protein HeimC2_41580 [Candidatus Heimdallarchaeota archaeon LC_2]
MLSDYNNFIFFIKDDEYEELRKTRLFKLFRSRSRYNISQHDHILFGTKAENGEKAIIAEYEVVSTEKIGKGTKISFEPIYNAPKHQGLKLKDLLTLSMSKSLNLEKSVVKLSEKDFIFLSRKLSQ